MKRNVNEFFNKRFDLIIIGGGIYGASLAWRAAIEGMSVALIEKNDFASGSSANSQKIIHGGIRYLQDFDFLRIFESIKSKKQLQYIAPHLVKSLKCVMPLYGHGFKGKEVVTLGFSIFNMLVKSYYKALNIQDERCKVIRKNDYQNIVPGIKSENLSGGGLWYDGFCENTERLIIDFIKSAVDKGAIVANYVEMENFLFDGIDTKGILVKDKTEGKKFEIRGNNVIDCSGPSINKNLDLINKGELKFDLIGGINLVTEKLFDHDYAVAIPDNKKEDSRFYFIAPWLEYSILGTEWFKSEGANNEIELDSFIKKFINDFDSAFPSAEIKSKRIFQVHFGNVPAEKDENEPMKKYKILDENDHGKKGLYFIVGVKYTTALDIAEKVIKKITGKKLNNKKLSKIYDNTEILLNRYENNFSGFLDYAIDEEMAVDLTDIFHRRPYKNILARPSDDYLNKAAERLAEKYNLSDDEKLNMVKRFNECYNKIEFLNNKLFN